MFVGFGCTHGSIPSVYIYSYKTMLIISLPAGAKRTYPWKTTKKIVPNLNIYYH